jgi:predicted nucleotidyltransferase
MAAVEELKRALESCGQVELAILFGSHARGRATRRSDLDLAVRLNPDEAAGRAALQQILRRKLAQHVDIVFLPEAPPLLRMEIARHGVVLVERRPHGWSAFRARAMIDWGDWAPFARRLQAAAARRLERKVDHGPE